MPLVGHARACGTRGKLVADSGPLPYLAVSLFGLALATMPARLFAQNFPEPNPPVRSPVVQPDRVPAQVKPGAPTTEWTNHKSTDGLDPSGAEQKMLWLMNRARMDPTAEGIWLAESTDPDVAGGRNFFNVDLDMLKSDLAALPVKPPAAFDIRIHDASELHSLDLIARDAQDHDGQFDKVDASGFNCNGGRVSVFSFSDSALHAHAALNIDWGNGPGGVQDPPGHRFAIMGVEPFAGVRLTNVGLAMVPENDPVAQGGSLALKTKTHVGPLIFSGAYCQAGMPDHNRFIVGTAWEDLNSDGDYDEDEGLAGVTVMPDNGTFFAVTGDAGGYAIPITLADDYMVTFSGGDLGASDVTLPVTVGADSVQLDLKLGTDSDGDGVPDEDDAFPNDPNESVDTDSDGIGNNADTDDDGDSMPDDFELTNGLDPLDAVDAGADDDGDGFTNLEEFQAGTDPQDAADFPPEKKVPISIFILLGEDEQ